MSHDHPDLDARTLFDMTPVAVDSPRLRLLKEHDIQTHYAPHAEPPWLAIPMNAAKERIGETDESIDSPAEMTASFAVLLDDFDLIFYGTSQAEVENAALQWAMEQAFIKNHDANLSQT